MFPAMRESYDAFGSPCFVDGLDGAAYSVNYVWYSLKCLPRSGSFTLGIKSKSQGLMSGEYRGWYSTSHCHLTSNWFTTSATCGRALCRMIGVFSPRKYGLPQRTAQMMLQEIDVVLACDCPMLGHSMCEDDACTVVGENDHNLSIAGILLYFGLRGDL